MNKVSETGQGKRDELINAGFEIMIKTNSTNFSIKDVTEKINAAVGLFYYYFASKEDFIYEVIRTYMMDFANKMRVYLEDESLNTKEKVHLVFSTLAKHFQKTPTVLIQNSHNGNVGLVLAFKITEGMRPIVIDCISSGIEKEEIAPNPAFDVDTLTDFILYGITGILLNADIQDTHLGSTLEKYAFELLNIT